MLTLLYPQQDYTSAEIALKIQSLVASEGRKIYTVPKHFGRNETTVQKNLEKSNPVVFLAYDTTVIDDQTKSELEFLTQKSKEVIAVVPKDFLLQQSLVSKSFTYARGDKAEFINAINTYIETIDEEKKNSDDGFGLLAVIGVLLIALVFLVTGNKDDDEDE